MGSESVTPHTSTTGGWQCPYCLQWVNHGAEHACPSTGKYEAKKEVHYVTIEPCSPCGSQCAKTLEELRDSLRRILEELRQIRRDSYW